MTATTERALPPQAEGFDAYYDSNISPELQKLEGHRKTAVLQFKIVCGVAVLGIVSFIAGAGFATGTMEDVLAFGGMALLFGGVLGAVLIHNRAHGKIKKVLVGGTCAFMGLEYADKDFQFPFNRFKDAQLLPSHDKRKLEDRIAGTHDGVAFELCEAHLERRKQSGGDNSNKDSTVFRGLLLKYNFSKPFHGQTVVVPDFTWLGNMLGGAGKTGERVTLEDPRFEKQFEVYSTDQVEARYLLTPRFMERLTELAGHFGNTRGLSVAFDENDLLIAVRSNQDRFEGGGLFESTTERKRADELLEELGLIYAIIDVLNLTDTTHA